MDNITIRIRLQVGLTLVGVGASSTVYAVGEHAVLKCGRVYEPPRKESSGSDAWNYASETLFHLDLLRRETKICRLIQKHPHPNIVKVIDTNHSEGIYLQRYQGWSQHRGATIWNRISKYADILRGLAHLHSLEIAHGDLRMENVLCDEHGQAIVSDFSASGRFGEDNPACPHPGRPVTINGLAETISDATDRFAAASLIYKAETGVDPSLDVDEHGALVLPSLDTGLEELDSIIKDGWLGNLSSTAKMLERLEVLEPSCRSSDLLPPDSSSDQLLHDDVMKWREARKAKFGCILYDLATEDTIQEVADEFGLNMTDQLSLLMPRIPSSPDIHVGIDGVCEEMPVAV